MSILLNTFRNRLFSTVVAGLAMSNVALAGHGGGGGGKSFGGGMATGRMTQPVKSFVAPKMVSQQQLMKNTQSNFVSKNFGKVQTLNSPATLGKPGTAKTSDLFKKVGKDSSVLTGANKVTKSDLLTKVGVLDQTKVGDFKKLPSSPTNNIPKPGDVTGPFKTGGLLDKKNSKIGDILKDPGKIGTGKIDPGKIDPGKVDPGKVDPGKGTPTDPGKGTPPTTPTDPGMGKGKCGPGFPWWLGAVGGFGGGYVAGGYPVYTQPVTVVETAAPVTAPLETSQLAQADTGSVDLVLEDVRLVERASIVAGPSYAVRFRNQGTANAGKFRVAIFAGRTGSPNDQAPRTIVEVPHLAAGGTSELTLRLPASAMRLASSEGTQGAFDQLLVVIDPDDAVVESEKTNNLAAVDRADLESQAH
ncbi:MAG TPA: CARDB domain-containing protein [Pirellulales bacterium]|jgi:hypothetical protein|nr:CARDB domain-containing protein [Pirellulales bacterium]